MKNKKITFLPLNQDAELVTEGYVPSKLTVPEWYKKSERFDPNTLKFSDKGELINTKLKMCVPFLDALTIGYTQTTWTDIFIENENGKVLFYYSSEPKIIDLRQHVSLPLGEEFYNLEFLWNQYWDIKVPDGYSVLITHPLNRFDLPFVTSSGVVDSDVYYHTASMGTSVPFYIKKGFTGVIPKGTPMYQVIPFKRENWYSEKEKYDKASHKKRSSLIVSKFWGAYKDLFWQKKIYE